MTETTKPQLNPFLKLAFDLGPLALFFFANSRYGIFVATATFMVAVMAALAASYVLTRTFRSCRSSPRSSFWCSAD